jgi:rhodanese-related sulfurtransferase
MHPHSVSLRRWFRSMLLLSLLLLPLRSQAAVATMTTDELRAKLDSPEVVIVDVRLGKDWKASESKIKGAIRVEAEAIETLANTYSKDKTVVFYCA